MTWVLLSTEQDSVCWGLVLQKSVHLWAVIPLCWFLLA